MARQTAIDLTEDLSVRQMTFVLCFLASRITHTGQVRTKDVREAVTKAREMYP